MIDDAGDGQRIKLNIQCPHCEESFNSGELASRQLGKSKWGIGVFACPHCDGHIKVEPTEYIYLSTQLRAGELPEGIGIVAFKADELTPSETVSRRSQTALGTPTNRAQTYRSAGRTLRYPVYVAMEWAWAAIALYAVGRDLLITPGDAPIAALSFLIALALAHSTKMAFLQPWQLLKAILVGVIAFGAALGIVSLSSALFAPAVPAVVIASAYYLWLGELWTRRVAGLNEEQ